MNPAHIAAFRRCGIVGELPLSWQGRFLEGVLVSQPFAFCVPLLPKAVAADWGIVVDLLEDTLTSLENQHDHRFVLLLAGHEMPELRRRYSFEIIFLQADWPTGSEIGEKLRDKRWKRRLLLRELRARGGGYAMFLDADDLVSNRLVEHVLNDGNPNGYVIEQGYAYDRLNRRIAPIPGAWSGSFDSVCGSCTVIKFNRDDLPADGDSSEQTLGMQLKRHSEWKEVMSGVGRPLAPVPFPAAVYVLNHSQNLHNAIKQNRDQQVPRKIAQRAIDLDADLRTEFSIRTDQHYLTYSGESAMNASMTKQLLDIQGTILENAIRGEDESHYRKALVKDFERVFHTLLREVNPEIVLEVGAHEATFSRVMKRLLPERRIVAMEANASVFQKHAEYLQVRGIEYVNLAATDKAGIVSFNVPLKVDHKERATMGSLLTDSQSAAHNVYEVPGVPLDDFLGEDADRPNAMWIDVEGAIGTVLKGATRTLSNCLALYAEVEPTERWPGQMLDHGVIDELAQFGLVPIARDVQRRNWQYNVIFVREALLDEPMIKVALARYGRLTPPERPAAETAAA